MKIIVALPIFRLLSSKCPEVFENRTLLDDCFTGEDFIAHTKNVSFSGESGAISFNNDGDMLGTYRYMIITSMRDISPVADPGNPRRRGANP